MRADDRQFTVMRLYILHVHCTAAQGQIVEKKNFFSPDLVTVFAAVGVHEPLKRVYIYMKVSCTCPLLTVH